jgi:hypothetical protein
MQGEAAQPIWTPTPQFASASRIAITSAGWRSGAVCASTATTRCGAGRSTIQPHFWQSIWDYFDLQTDAPVSSVLSDAPMPGARWFEGARLNYVQQVFRHARADRPAIRYAGEAVPLSDMSWAELQRQVAGVAASLRAMGVGPGDRVAAYLPNIPQTVVAFLATASIGAVWSVCAPEMGPVAVLDRFRQIEPKVLFAVAGYRHGGRRARPRRGRCANCWRDLPGVQHWVLVPQPGPREIAAAGRRRRIAGDDLLLQCAELRSNRCPSTIRCGSSTPRAPRGCRRRSCTATAASSRDAEDAVHLHCDIGPATASLVHEHRLDHVERAGRRPAAPAPPSCCTTAVPATPDFGRCGASSTRPVSRFSAPARRSSPTASRPGSSRRASPTCRGCARWGRPARRCRRKPTAGFTGT